MAEVRPDVAALTFELVTAHALRLGPLEENLFALRRVAAKERLSIFRQRIILRSSGLIVRELLLHGCRGTFRGGFQEIELQFLRHLARLQPIEPLRKNFIRRRICQSAERIEYYLFLSHGPG